MRKKVNLSKGAFLLFLVTIPILEIWKLEPVIYIAAIRLVEPEDDPLARFCVNHLVRCGGRAVDPILDDIATGSLWSKGTRILPDVLRRIGPEAHRALLRRIPEEPKIQPQIYYCYCLQQEFSDFRYLPLFLNLVKSRKEDRFGDWMLRKSLESRFEEDIPQILDGGKISHKFISWYKHHEMTGDLPRWNSKY